MPPRSRSTTRSTKRRNKRSITKRNRRNQYGGNELDKNVPSNIISLSEAAIKRSERLADVNIAKLTLKEADELKQKIPLSEKFISLFEKSYYILINDILIAIRDNDIDSVEYMANYYVAYTHRNKLNYYLENDIKSITSGTYKKVMNDMPDKFVNVNNMIQKLKDKYNKIISDLPKDKKPFVSYDPKKLSKQELQDPNTYKSFLGGGWLWNSNVEKEEKRRKAAWEKLDLYYTMREKINDNLEKLTDKMVHLETEYIKNNIEVIYMYHTTSDLESLQKQYDEADKHYDSLFGEFMMFSGGTSEIKYGLFVSTFEEMIKKYTKDNWKKSMSSSEHRFKVETAVENMETYLDRLKRNRTKIIKQWL